MASTRLRLPANAPGELYVDSSCIDCDTCRWMAPAVFDRAGEQSRVKRQPAEPDARRAALQALVACPTASIGTEDPGDTARVARASRDFPLLIDEDVYHCGYHAEASFGAASYLIRRPPERGGNVLVDSPRWSEHLARRIEELGGLAWLFLTHRDDVADHERYARHFGCKRVLHAADVEDGTREVERVIDGLEPVALDPELLVIPVPGHTAGSTCLLYRARYLFSGDHVAWSASRGHVYAFRSVCWHSWAEQIESMERLARHDFEWILPGHGRRCRFEREAMRAQVQRCIAWMR